MTARLISLLPTTKKVQLKTFSKRKSSSSARIILTFEKCFTNLLLLLNLPKQACLKLKIVLKNYKKIEWHHFSLQDLYGNRKNRYSTLLNPNFAIYYSPLDESS